MNIQAENREGYIISVEMKKLWNVQMQMLLKLLDVCSRHGLRIWAEGGTLLGTVRHKGYIPWDDDIDMIMFRKDYESLVQISKEEFKSPFFFQCFETEKSPYGRWHAQVRMEGTTAILSGDRYMSNKIHKGIFIDIFVMDDVPNDEEKRKAMAEHVHHELGILQNRTAYYRLRLTLKTTPYRKFFRYWLSDKEFRRRYWKILEYVKSFESNNNECVAEVNFFKNKDYQTIRKKKWYDKTNYMQFEDVNIPVPYGYDEILTAQYGDWRTPRQAPSIHGGYLILDFNKPYSVYGF